MRRKGNINMVMGVVSVLVIVSVLLGISIYIVDSVQQSANIPALDQSYTATNSTKIDTGATASAIRHDLTLSLPSSESRYYQDYGSLEVTFNYTTPTGGLDVYVNGYLLGHISASASSPITFSNVSKSWILSSYNPVNVTYYGYNASVTQSVLTLQTDPTEYRLSQAHQNTVSNVATAFDIASIIPLVMIAGVIIVILVVFFKVRF